MARRGRLTTAQVSRVLSGERRAGPETSLGIARGLGIPPEDVFRRAGLLPRRGPAPEGADELLILYGEMDEDDRKRLLAVARALRQLGRTPER